MTKSYYIKIIIIFSFFLLISFASYILVTISLNKENEFNNIINLAEQERKLMETINKKAIQFAFLDISPAGDELFLAQNEFEKKLDELMDEDTLEGLNLKQNPNFHPRLNSINKQWKSLKFSLEQILSRSGDKRFIMNRIDTKNKDILLELEYIIEVLENERIQSNKGLTTANIIFILLILFLVLVLAFTWHLLSIISKSEKKYRILVDFSPIGIMMIKDQKVNFANNFARHLLGFANEKSIVGKPIHDFISSKSVLSFTTTSKNRDYDDRKGNHLAEEKWIKVDGTTVNVEVKSIPITILRANLHLVVFLDVTKQKRSENELKDIKLALDLSSVVEITDADDVILYVNDKCCEVTKYEKEELIGSTHKLLNSGYHSKEFFKDLWDTVKSGQAWEGHVRNRAKDGSNYWVHTTIIPFLDDDGEPYQYITIRNDITKRKLIEDEIRTMAIQDHLTQLSNRRKFEKELQHCIDMNKSVAVFFIDLDRFKYVNDTLGHNMGDQLIKLVANRLKNIVGPNVLVSRQGGDEFALLVPYHGNKTEISKLAKDIIDRIKLPYMLEKKEIVITCSIGISIYPAHGKDLNALIKNADVAMYWSKEKGKNNFSYYQEHMKDKSARIMQLELELRKAIENEEFVLYYQPKKDLFTGKIMGCEALIRWNHPTLGMIPPAEFIPLAEETGLINEMGEWVIKEACIQNKKWQKAGYPELVIAVNISAHQFKQTNLTNITKRILTETGLESRFIEFEITESVSMLNNAHVIKVLHELKEIGISIAIDDFGTGYSSLQYLHKFPADSLKIDKSFITEIGQFNNSSSSVMTNVIISLAKALNLKVIAEGIETTEQMNYLINHQCDIGQGYLISKPLPATEFEKLIIKVPKQHRMVVME